MDRKILLLPLLVLLSFIAVTAGIAAGNFVYSLDSGLVRSIDTENYKSTLNISFPIINTVYNSGFSSVSISGEIKNMIRGIFDFDIEKPVTILNAQSSLFSYYFMNGYKPVPPEEGQLPGNVSPPPPETDPGRNNEPEKAIQQPDTAPPENGQEAEQPDDGKEELPQPISSITYTEDEDEEDGESGDIVSHEKIVVQNYTKFKIDIEKLLKEPLNINFSKKGPKALIYHTHTTESYVLKASDIGKNSIPSFNTNPRYNVVRVGEELARNLKKYGIEVLHNGTVHDTVRDAAYGPALKTLQKYVKSYPSIKVFLDIHRDAANSSKKLSLTKKINGKNAAQIMFVVGTNGMLPHPQWKENLKFALKLQKYLNEKYPGLARPVWISSKRYNQHISDKAIIIEIGGDGNLLSECLESSKYVAEALNAVMKGK